MPTQNWIRICKYYLHSYQKNLAQQKLEALIAENVTLGDSDVSEDFTRPGAQIPTHYQQLPCFSPSCDAFPVSADS